MRCEWKKTTLEEVCCQIYSGGTPNKKHSEYYEGGTIPWLNTSEIKFNRIYSTEKYISDKGYLASSAKWVPENSVIVAMYGATAARVALTKIPLTTNQACCNLIVNNDKADYRYVYYWLYSKYTQLSSLANGGAQQNLNIGQIKGFPILIPCLEVQVKIANLLSILDDKIDSNTIINNNLEQQVQALYQKQFGNVDLTKKQGVLADICSYSKDRVAVSELKTSNYFSTENLLQGKSGAIEATNLPTTTQTTACHRGDTLISNIRPYFKKILYCEGDCGCSPDVLCFTPVQSRYSAFLFSTLYADKFFDFMVAGSKGTKMPRGDKQQIMTYPVVVPSDEELEAYNTVVFPILAQIQYNRRESKNLAELRDTLLPRLMSGEFDVSDIDL